MCRRLYHGFNVAKNSINASRLCREKSYIISSLNIFSVWNKVRHDRFGVLPGCFYLMEEQVVVCFMVDQRNRVFFSISVSLASLSPFQCWYVYLSIHLRCRKPVMSPTMCFLLMTSGLVQILSTNCVVTKLFHQDVWWAGLGWGLCVGSGRVVIGVGCGGSGDDGVELSFRITHCTCYHGAHLYQNYILN